MLLSHLLLLKQDVGLYYLNLMASHAEGEIAVKMTLGERNERHCMAHVRATADRMR